MTNIAVSANRNCLSALGGLQSSISEIANVVKKKTAQSSRRSALLLLQQLIASALGGNSIVSHNCHDYMFLEYGNLIYGREQR